MIFKQASGTSRGILRTKETFLLKIIENTKEGYGECGVFRGLSADDRPDYEEKLQWLCTNINSDLEELLNDLINKTNHIKNEFELINHLKARYNAWCLLFKPGRKKLKENEILGLAAELLFAEIWTQKLGESIEGWVGPLKKHQDFISMKNKLAYEIKLGNWDPESIKISSIEQLDFDGSLSLVVFPGKISEKNEKSAKSLPILIEELKKLLSKEEVFVLENRLMAAGFDEKECQDIFFEIGRPMIFEISEDFPKLIRNIVPNAISKCSYTLVLSDLDSYKVDLTN